MPTPIDWLSWAQAKAIKRRFAFLNFLSMCLCFAAVGQPAPTEASFSEKMADHTTLDSLRKGGYVLYLRHGTTDASRADQVPSVNLNDCKTQRVLNEEGRQLAVAIGKALRTAQIPVSTIYSSPLCRAKETAKLAFPDATGEIKIDDHLMYTANLTSKEKMPVIAATRRLVSEPVKGGSNRVIVAHAPNMADLMGYFVKPEGTIVIIQPLGQDKFEYVASIPPGLWPRLLRK